MHWHCGPFVQSVNRPLVSEWVAMPQQPPTPALLLRGVWAAPSRARGADAASLCLCLCRRPPAWGQRPAAARPCTPPADCEHALQAVRRLLRLQRQRRQLRVPVGLQGARGPGAQVLVACCCSGALQAHIVACEQPGRARSPPSPTTPASTPGAPVWSHPAPCPARPACW